jgi:hypothetical protein
MYEVRVQRRDTGSGSGPDLEVVGGRWSEGARIRMLSVIYSDQMLAYNDWRQQRSDAGVYRYIATGVQRLLQMEVTSTVRHGFWRYILIGLRYFRRFLLPGNLFFTLVSCAATYSSHFVTLLCTSVANTLAGTGEPVC